MSGFSQFWKVQEGGGWAELEAVVIYRLQGHPPLLLQTCACSSNCLNEAAVPPLSFPHHWVPHYHIPPLHRETFTLPITVLSPPCPSGTDKEEQEAGKGHSLRLERRTEKVKRKRRTEKKWENTQPIVQYQMQTNSPSTLSPSFLLKLLQLSLCDPIANVTVINRQTFLFPIQIVCRCRHCFLFFIRRKEHFYAKSQIFTIPI